MPVSETSSEYWNVYDRLTRAPDASLAKVDPKTRWSSDTRGMHDAWITQLYRIQNPDLYTYFEQKRQQLTRTNGQNRLGRKAFDGLATDSSLVANPVAMDPLEDPMGKIRAVVGWHGTRTFDAENIYNDQQHGCE